MSSFECAFWRVALTVFAAGSGFALGWGARGDAWSRGSTLTAEDIGHIHNVTGEEPPRGPTTVADHDPAALRQMSRVFAAQHIGMVSYTPERVDVVCDPGNWVPLTFFEPGGLWSLRCVRPSWLYEDGGVR